MNCPNKETMQDFIEGELPEAKNQQIAEHIYSCNACKIELREILTLYDALNQIVSEDKCPSLDILKSYADNACADDKIAGFKDHLELCYRCRSYVWAFQASEKELQEWQKQDELAYQEFKAKDLGYNAAQETLQKLLPDKIELLDKTWQSVLTFVLDLKDKAMESWPSFDKGAHLIGALGFAESYDPETDAAFVILVTTLYVSQAVSDGQVKPCQKDIDAAVKEAAVKFGAGKELTKRLIETVPPLVLRFM